MLRFARTFFALALLVGASVAQDNLGLGKMWTFEDAPVEYWKATYGFSPEQPWLDHARLASLRFGSGCSSSFVSPRGLILTNHHCARNYIAAVSPKDQDWIRDGFVARSLAEEVKVPGLTVQQLVGTRDVTVLVEAGVTDADTSESAEKKRKANEEKLVEEAKKANPDLTPQIVRLYQGAVIQLYSYRVFDDIRLCAAPHLQTAHYGGDPDNFTYPRYSIDFSLLRAYVDGKPADTAGMYFKWAEKPLAENELVFVTGNPGSTDRSRTLAQLDFFRQAAYPIRMEQIDHRLEILRAYAKTGADAAKAVKPEILNLENGQKAFRGYFGGLVNANLMAQKTKDEESLRKKIDERPDFKDKYASAFPKLEEICAARSKLHPKITFQSVQGSKILQLAVLMVRATDPKFPEDRRTSARNQLETFDLAEAPFEPAAYVDHLERAQKWLAKDDPFLKEILGGRSAKEAYMNLLATSKLKDLAGAKELLTAGDEAVQKSDDVALRVARVLSPLIAANQAEAARLAAEENAQGVRIGQALFSVYGRRIAPDATFTLRIADGLTAGFPYNGTIAPWRTSFYGLYARAAEFGNQYPFDLPPTWSERKDKIDLGKFVNFASTNDIIGGNSGSPVINKNLELVGLIFDGNIESLANRFLFTDDVPRSVSVHTDAILESLQKIYDAEGLANELLGKGGY